MKSNQPVNPATSAQPRTRKSKAPLIIGIVSGVAILITIIVIVVVLMFSSKVVKCTGGDLFGGTSSFLGSLTPDSTEIIGHLDGDMVTSAEVKMFYTDENNAQLFCSDLVGGAINTLGTDITCKGDTVTFAASPEMVFFGSDTNEQSVSKSEFVKGITDSGFTCK